MAEETKVIRIIVDSTKAVEGSAAATRAFERMEKQQAAATTALERMGQTVDRIGTLLKANFIFLMAEVATKIIAMARGALDAAGNLGEMADQMGVTVSGLQGMQLAAVQNRMTLEQLETGIGKFSQKIGEASNGSKEMLDALNGLGVKILDTQGKLRPTEDLLQNVAAAIMAIDDPAKRVAASVDFFGKAGAKMLPMMPELAKGFDSMADGARKAGAYISEEAIAKLDKLGDSSERNKLKLRALFAENLAGPLTSAIEAATAAAAKLLGLLGQIPALLDKLGAFAREQTVKDIQSDIIPMWDKAIQNQTDAVASAQRRLNSVAGSVAGGYTGAGAKLLQERQAEVDAAEQKLRDYIQSRTAADERMRGIQSRDQQIAQASRDKLNSSGRAAARGDELRTYPTPGDGASNPAAKGGGGETPDDKYAKLLEQLETTRKAQEAMTAAARAGDQAFTDQQATLDAQTKLLAIYGTKLGFTDEQLKKVRDDLLAIAQGKAAEAFNVATTELDKQNKLLETQISLMDKAPEIQARELANVKALQEAQKAGTALTAEDIEHRRAAIEVNERLKLQQQELQKAQEMWTEPLKQALRDIQTAGANAFEQLLESGKFSAQSLGETFSKILKRMAAEFLALATIRPVMNVIVNAVGQSGILPQSAIQSMGYGGQLSPTSGLQGTGGIFGGGSGQSIGDWFSGLQNSLFGGGSTTVAGSPASTIAPAGTSSLGFFNPSSGLQLGSFGMGNLFSGGLSIGAGAMSLLNGGTKTTAGTIGGVGQMVGGALMMIPTPWTMAAGAVISLASSILPSLFGQKEPTITNQAYGQLAYGSGGWGTSGGAWGPSADMNALTGQLGGAGSSISSIFDALGGVKDPGKVWGLALQSFSQQYGSKGGTFANQTSFLVDPSGNKTQWGMGSTAADVGLGAASAQVAIRSIVGGAVGAISEAMKTALNTVGARAGGGSLQEVGSAITFVQAYDNLGKTAIAAEAALKKVNETFGAMKTTAESLGLSLEPVTAEMEKQRKAVATDFADSLGRELDPTKYALKDLDKWREQMVAENKYLLDNVTGALDQINQIEKVYAQRRTQIVEQGAQTTLTGLIKALLPGGGALANAGASEQFAGLQATYQATRAQAMAGDTAAIGRYATDAQAYLAAGLTYYGGNSQYVAARNQVLADAIGFAGTSGNYDQVLTQIASMMQQLQQMNAANQEDNARLIGLLTRYVAK